ncbi:MAG: hypothetical protein KAH38_05185, partial [Candidatus Hydrogenedentes bacterium]|nr:hypothetical protein [Candidatus Hydrogenedentota bacterium]
MLTPIEKILFLIILLGFTGYVVKRTHELVLLLRMGKPDPNPPLTNPFHRILDMVMDVVLQRRVLRKPV